MSRLSATFVLNYLTRVVPSLGHVGMKMKADRVVKGAAILVAIGGVFGGDAAIAANFAFSTLPNVAQRTIVPTPNGAAIDYATNTGVTVRMVAATNGSLVFFRLAPGNADGPEFAAPSVSRLGQASATDPNPNTALYSIDQATGAAPGSFDTMGLRVQFLNAAGNVVPVQNLRFRTIDIDKDDTSASPPVWQDEVTAFATFGNAASATAATPATTTVGTVSAFTGLRQATVPAGLNFTGAIPVGLTFVGIDDIDTIAAVASASIDDPFTPSLDGIDGTGGPVSEAFNRSQEGTVEFSTATAPADGFIVLYSDGVVFNNTNPTSPSFHGLGMLSDFRYSPGIIGVRKRVTNVVNNGATVTVSYEVSVTNLGEVALTNIELDDNLSAAVSTYDQSFGNIPAAGLTISGLTSATLSTNNAGPGIYDGGSSDQLLAAGGAGNNLAIAETKTLSYNVTFTPGAITQFNTQVVATGTMTGGGITRDRSNDGARVEDATPGDNDPTAVSALNSETLTSAANFNASTGILTAAGAGDDTVTSFILPAATPKIGVTKQVISSVPAADGTLGAYDVTYRQIVSNVSSTAGSEALTTVTLTEDFSNNNNPNPASQNAFRIGQANGAASATVVAVRVPTASELAAYPSAGYIAATPNTSFTGGAGNQNLITTPLSFPVRGNYSIVDYVVRVVPQPGVPLEGLPPFEGQAIASGNFPQPGVGGTGQTVDKSDDVTSLPAASQISPPDGSADTPLSGTGVAVSNPIPALDVTNGVNNATTNENNRTPVSFAAPSAAKIALSKRVTGVVDNGNGTFDVTYRQLVQNTGTVPLTSVKVTENLDDTFRRNQSNGARAIEVRSITVPALGTLGIPVTPGVNFKTLTPGALNPTATTINMLAGGDSLAPNEYGVVDFVVRVTPGNSSESYGLPLTAGAFSSFNGSAIATGDIADGLSPTDRSEDAAQFPKGTVGAPLGAKLLDADGLIDPATASPLAGPAAESNENTPTPVLFPQIAVAKRISNISGTGTAADPFIVEYTVVTTNVGAITLNNVQTNETSLDQNFPNAQVPDANATFVAGSLANVSGVVAPLNSAPDGFTAEDGVANQNLFREGLTLEPTQSTTVRYQVRLVSPPNDITFNSQSAATGSGVAAPTALDVPQLTPRDLSDDGSTPDPNAGDGLRGRGPGEDDPTPLRFPIAPQIGLTKQVFGTPVNNNDGTYDVTFRYRVQNTGLVPLTGVSIADNLQAQFAGQGLNRTTNPPPVDEFLGVVGNPTPRPTEGTGPAIVVGSSPNRGRSDIPADALGTVPGTLGIGESSVVDVVVRVRPGAANLTNRYDGAARAVGLSVGAIPTAVNDISDDGTFLNGVAQTPTPDVLKAPVGNPNDPNAQNSTPVILSQSARLINLFKAITKVPGESFTSPLDVPGIPAFATNVVGKSTVPRNLTNGDLVEYTLYAVNATDTAILTFEVCDPLPGDLRFVRSEGNTTFGVSQPASFPPLVPPTGGQGTCNEATRANGSPGGTVVFSIPNLPARTSIPLPFTVRIQR